MGSLESKSKIVALISTCLFNIQITRLYFIHFCEVKHIINYKTYNITIGFTILSIISNHGLLCHADYLSFIL